MKKMYCALPTAFILILATAVFGQRGLQWRGSGGWGPGEQYGKMYDVNTVETISGEVLAVEATRDIERAELPPAVALGPRTRAILIGDFLIEPKLFAERLSTIAARGASGHMVMIADPVEETFPFAGHVELVDSDSPATLRLGRAESWRADYEQRLARHRAEIFDISRAHGFSVLVHRTDRPASEALIALRARLEEGATGGRA